MEASKNTRLPPYSGEEYSDAEMGWMNDPWRQTHLVEETTPPLPTGTEYSCVFGWKRGVVARIMQNG